MKKIFLFMFVLMTTLTAVAQDALVLKTGEILNVKVEEVTPTEIKYHKFENMNGPLYTILKADAISVRYENGQQETFNVKQSRNEESTSRSYDDSNNHSFINSDTRNYGRLTFSPIFSQPSISGKNYSAKSDEDMLYGLGIGYLFGINITGHHAPLFLEIGPEVNVLTRQNEDYHNDEDLWILMASINTPINICYKLRLSDNISLAPFVGLNARLNLVGMEYLDDESYDFFDEDDNEVTPNRFQLGMNMGFGAYFNHFYVGYRYNPEITPYAKDGDYKMEIVNHYLTLGVKF